MITEIVSEYAKYMRIPKTPGKMWKVGPLNFEQYMMLLLVAKFNGALWSSGHIPTQWEGGPRFPEGVGIEPSFLLRRCPLILIFNYCRDGTTVLYRGGYNDGDPISLTYPQFWKECYRRSNDY